MNRTDQDERDWRGKQDRTRTEAAKRAAIARKLQRSTKEAQR